jgi:hypothetical protein
MRYFGSIYNLIRGKCLTTKKKKENQQTRRTKKESNYEKG